MQGITQGTRRRRAVPSSSRLYRAATGFARGWLDRYTDGLHPPYVERRRQQLDFELWEHAEAADRHRRFAWTSSAEIVLLTLAGVHEDLAWRRAARRGAAVHVLPGVAVLVQPRHRRRFWVPLHPVPLFDQTNGVLRDEEPAAPAPDRFVWFGSLGSLRS